jgi:MFS transporter, PAT family, beta-lactamase induction signal transducer AmpG
MGAQQPEPPRPTDGAGGIRAFGSRRVAIMVGLGVASALPNSLADSTLSTWMATLKVDLKTIGYFSLVLLPYNIKFLWAPFLDRYRLPFLGRRRGWMLTFLLAAAACVFMLGSSDPQAHAGAVAALAFGVAFMGASFDVVNDAYKTDVLRPQERAAGNAAYTVGWRIALLLTGSAALVLAEWLPWRVIYIGLGCLLIVGVLCTLAGPEPEQEVAAPRTFLKAVVEPFVDFFRRPRSLVVLAFMLFYSFGDTIVAKMLNVFYVRQVGFRLVEIGTINKITVSTATVAGAVTVAAVMARLGFRKCVWIFGAAAAASNLLYILLAEFGKSYGLLVLASGVDNFFGGMRSTVMLAFLTGITNMRYSATQYALFSSATSVLGRIVAASSGHVIEAVGWSGYFVLTSVLALPALVIFAFVPASYSPTAGDRR